MLVFGRVSNVNYEDYSVKLIIDDYDSFETPWLIVPQLWTGSSKTGFMPEINSVCAAIMNEEMTEGALLGAMYNKTDTVLSTYAGKEFVRFSDGVEICHTPGSSMIEITADQIKINGNILCSGDISDKTGTIQAVREWADLHVHTNGNDGANTGVPTTTIG